MFLKVFWPLIVVTFGQFLVKAYFTNFENLLLYDQRYSVDRFEIVFFPLIIFCSLSNLTISVFKSISLNLPFQYRLSENQTINFKLN